MTITPDDLAALPGPRYLALAEAIAAAIRSGRLAEGAQLPTQRELAHRLGVTVGTVGRAYLLAEQRGLIAGEVGRGTYVRDSFVANGGGGDVGRQGIGDGRITRPGELGKLGCPRCHGDNVSIDPELS